MKKAINKLIKNTSSFLSMYLTGWKRIFDIKGRSCREEFWAFSVINFILSAGLAVLGGFLTYGQINLNYSHVGATATNSVFMAFEGGLGTMTPYEIAFMATVIVICIPMTIANITQDIRRCHDINISGWFMLLFFVPLVNFLFLLYISFAQSFAELNKWGRPPKG